MITPTRLVLRPSVTEPVVPMTTRRQAKQHDVASLLDKLKPLLAISEHTRPYRRQMSLVVDVHGILPDGSGARCRGRYFRGIRGRVEIAR